MGSKGHVLKVLIEYRKNAATRFLLKLQGWLRHTHAHVHRVTAFLS